MTSRQPLWGPMLFTMLLGAASVQAADQCTAAFLFPVQSHATPGVLSMSNESKIISSTVGTSYPFLSKNIQSNANCNSGGSWDGGTWVSNCNVSGSLASPLNSLAFISDPNDFPANPEDFPSYSGQGDLSCDGAISPAAGDYKSASWGGSECVATLKSGQTYRFDTLSLSEGAVLNLNGATVYARTLTIKNDNNSGFYGAGNLHANALIVTGNGKLSGASVTVYDRLTLSTNSSGNVTASFQPHYLARASLSEQSQMLMAAGDWSIRNLEVQNNSAMTFQGQSTLSVHGLTVAGQGQITAAGSRSDLAIKLYQTVETADNAVINGYLSAHYVKTFNIGSFSNLYFSGGSHWIDTLDLSRSGYGTSLVFPSGDQARLYLKSDLTLAQGLTVNAGGKANDLMFYHFGEVTMSGQSKLNAILYVNAGDLDMSGEAQLTGAVSAVNVTMTDNSKIIHEPFEGDWPDICPFSSCKDIFTDPPTENASMTPPTGVLVSPLEDLVCSKQGSGTRCSGHGSNSFAPGDHDFNKGSIGNQAEIVATGVTARLYFNNLDLSNARLNLHNPPENLFIYVKGDLSITGQNEINAVLYVAGNIRVAGNATLEGALATGGNIDISGNGDYYFDQDAVDKVDLGGTTCGEDMGGTKVDHFELSHSGQALTCNPETVMIKACADESCSQLVTEQVTATLSVSPSTGSNGWSDGNQVTFSDGSTSAQLRNNTAGAVTIGVSSSTPAFLHETLCRAAGGEPSVDDCTLDFADSGFLFDVQDTYANKPQQVLMKAVKKDDASQQCVPGFADVSKPVSFWSDYIDPNGNTFGSKVTVNGSAVATSQAAAATTELAFDAQGEVTLTVNYPDAGKMQLNARHEGSGDSAGLVMTGADQFVSRPAGLCIKAPQGECVRDANATNADYASCPVFKKTGEDFPLHIQGVAWQADDDEDLCSGNLATPNFVLADIALGSELVAPKPGVEAAVGTTGYDHSNSADNNDNLNLVSQSLDEVGVFQMTATPPALGYFGYTIPPARSLPIGRFVPVDFALSNGVITPACYAVTHTGYSFTYMGQPFTAGYTLSARNHQQKTTLNYRDEFAKGQVVMVAANDQDGVDRSARISSLLSPEWAAGVALLDEEQPNTRFERGDAPENPLSRLAFGVRVDDLDGGNTLIAAPDMNAGIAGDCAAQSNCDARQLGVQDLRYGRLKVATEQGASSAPLALRQEVEFYQGEWRINELDDCTLLDLSGYEFTDPNQAYQGASQTLAFDGGSLDIGLGPMAPGSVSARVEGGLTYLQLGAPNQVLRVPYRVDLSQQPDEPLWLSDPGTLDGIGIFGNSRGNDRIIYRREFFE
ncbi:DUF6701 domain-containing protein [Aeromonas crassostreae]